MDGLLRRDAARHELPPSVVEVLREFLDDLRFTRWWQRDVPQTGADFRSPVRHVRLLLPGARLRRTTPTSLAGARGRGGRPRSTGRIAAVARRPSRPMSP